MQKTLKTTDKPYIIINNEQEKTMLKNCLLASVAFLGSLTLTSCALGSLGAGYSIKAKTADGLTGEAEQ